VGAVGATLAGRAIAESLMVDSCRIVSGSVSTLNEVTLLYEVVESVSYEGRCRLKFDNATVQEIDAAGQLLIGQRATLFLPVSGSAAVSKSHMVTVTSCVLDASLVGSRFRVEGPHHQSFATARRFPIEEVTG
jgi:hypothetical protein